MRAKTFYRVSLTFAIVACGVACGQGAKPGTGTVTGHVICADTQKPARFAQVMLSAVPSSVTPIGKIDTTDSKSIQAYTKVMTDAMSSANFVLSQTDFDGSFVVEDVPPGDYYLMASVAGYVQPQDLVQAAYDAGEDVTKGISGVAMLRVSAGRAVNADITVSRGAAVEGRVLWDDGGPVTSASVSVEPKSGEHKQLPPQFLVVRMNGASIGSTDDRGYYRISGLAPGEYTVRAMLQTNRRMTMQRGRMNPNGNFGTMPLVVYAPGAFRKIDAKPVTLTAGEERTDEDITFNLGSTHTVSGRVTSAEDHHGVNHAFVVLVDTSEKTFRRSAGVDDEGNFNVNFVPSGTYTITVGNAADTVPEEPKPGENIVVTGDRIVRSYDGADRQVIVTDNDVTGQNFELKPAKAAASQESGIGAVAGGIPQ